MNKQKVLLIGNGIYRAFHGEEESWENVLRFVKKEFEKQGMSLNLESSSKISHSLYFEYLYSVWKKNKGPQANESTAWSEFAKKIAFRIARPDAKICLIYARLTCSETKSQK